MTKFKHECPKINDRVRLGKGKIDLNSVSAIQHAPALKALNSQILIKRKNIFFGLISIIFMVQITLFNLANNAS